jgi:hypothetical protein
MAILTLGSAIGTASYAAIFATQDIAAVVSYPFLVSGVINAFALVGAIACLYLWPDRR